MTVKAKTKPAELELAEMAAGAHLYRRCLELQFPQAQTGDDRHRRTWWRLFWACSDRSADFGRWTPSTSTSWTAYQISSQEHPWGTDSLGRDTLGAGACKGGRVSLMIGISAMLVSISIGTIIGLVSGYFRSAR